MPRSGRESSRWISGKAQSGEYAGLGNKLNPLIWAMAKTDVVVNDDFLYFKVRPIFLYFFRRSS